jgi:hypothetical protein
MISQEPWYALAAPTKQAVRTSVVCIGSRPVLLPPLAGSRRHPEHIDYWPDRRGRLECDFIGGA